MMTILLIFSTYLYALSYEESEQAGRIKFLDHNSMKSTKFYLSIFIRKPLEMSLLFICCGSLACSLVDTYLNEFT